jgi:chromosome segregation and condensation protein ScpB
MEEQTPAGAGREHAKDLEKKRVVEAALFLANRPMDLAELALIAKTTVKRATQLARELAGEYEGNGNAFSIAFEGNSVRMEVRPEYLGEVAQLTKQVELSRKATRILGLIAKKGSMMQSQLKRYFRGDIYEYVAELKDKEYVSAEKRGSTRLLKPTKKFYETFQLVGEELAKVGEAAGKPAGEAAAGTNA